ncbi:MAG: putative peptide zinc metalloprotease protein [Actinomycetota bacterium]|jgi:putative peptide zinc metalloprotease protein
MKRTLIRGLATVLLALAVGIGGAPSARADEKTNEATAINTQDGSSVFRFALSVRDVANGVVDQTNTATAEASCVDCTTIAIAFQVIFVSGDDPNYVAPENRATAVNVQCSECLTYAKATQIVVDMNGMELSDRGKRRLKDLEKRMHEVERNANSMTDAQLLAEAQYAQNELLDIFNTELVPIDQSTTGGSTTTTSTTSNSTTSSSSSTTSSTTTTRPSDTTTTAAA